MVEAAVIVDPVLMGVTLLIYLTYHAYLARKIKKHPLETASGQVWISRVRWCDEIMKRELLIEGVQTIRNSIMSTSVLASTSLALSSVVVAFLASSASSLKLQESSLLKSPAISDGWRFFTVIVFFSCAFFCYMQSIRSGNHGSILLAIPMNQKNNSYYVTSQYVAKVLNRGAMFFTIGTRFFYLAFLAVLWLFGPIPPIAACVILVWILFTIDRYPDPHYHKRTEYDAFEVTDA